MRRGWISGPKPAGFYLQKCLKRCLIASSFALKGTGFSPSEIGLKSARALAPEGDIEFLPKTAKPPMHRLNVFRRVRSARAYLQIGRNDPHKKIQGL